MTAEGGGEMKWEWEKLLEAKDAEIAELRIRLDKSVAIVEQIMSQHWDMAAGV
jgi:hypothetical protein